MLIVAGTLLIDPDKLEDARVAASIMMKATREEPGNVAYVFSQDLEEPGRIHIFERWQDEDALETHFKTPHMIEFQGKLGGFGIKEMTVEKYTISAVGPLM